MSPGPIRNTTQEMQNWGFDEIFKIPTVEMVGYDPVAGALRRVTVDPLGNISGYPLTALFDYQSGTNPIYIGLAVPGTVTSDSKWQIKKLTYDGNNNVISIQYAGGTAQFNQIYDNRSSLIYS